MPSKSMDMVQRERKYREGALGRHHFNIIRPARVGTQRMTKQLFLQEVWGTGVSSVERGNLAGGRATDCQ